MSCTNKASDSGNHSLHAICNLAYVHSVYARELGGVDLLQRRLWTLFHGLGRWMYIVHTTHPETKLRDYFPNTLK